MEDRVKAEYDSILAEIVIEHGALVEPEPGTYGWMDTEWMHLKPRRSGGGGCAVVRHGTPVESEWSEFDGTFAEPPFRQVHGVDLPNVDCACGAMENRTIRLDTNLSKLTQQIFDKLYKRLEGNAWYSE